MNGISHGSLLLTELRLHQFLLVYLSLMVYLCFSIGCFHVTPNAVFYYVYIIFNPFQNCLFPLKGGSPEVFLYAENPTQMNLTIDLKVKERTS
jgi:hypothetical protein